MPFSQLSMGSCQPVQSDAKRIGIDRAKARFEPFVGRARVGRKSAARDRIEGTYDVAWSSMALHHVPDLDGLLRALAGLLADGGRLAIADLDRDPDGAFHADKVDFDGHHGFDRQHLAAQLERAGFSDIGFADATTILKNDREFGVFLCTATKGD